MPYATRVGTGTLRDDTQEVGEIERVRTVIGHGRKMVAGQGVRIGLRHPLNAGPLAKRSAPGRQQVQASMRLTPGQSYWTR